MEMIDFLFIEIRYDSKLFKFFRDLTDLTDFDWWPRVSRRTHDLDCLFNFTYRLFLYRRRMHSLLRMSLQNLSSN